MRLMKSTLSVAVIIAAASVYVSACSKDKDDDDDDETPAAVSTENKADATKASAAAASGLTDKLLSSGSGSGLLSHESRMQIRALYRQARAERQRFLQADDGTQGGVDVDICAIFSMACQSMKETPPTLSETGASACAVTCPETAGSLSMACTLDSMPIQCKETTYTMSAAKVDMTMACTKAADGVVTLAIGSKFSGSISGGTIASATALACSFDFSQTFDAAAQQSESVEEPEVDCSKFSCTIGGTALSCDEIKASVTAKDCGEGSALTSNH
jgi:hypothetical protein